MHPTANNSIGATLIIAFSQHWPLHRPGRLIMFGAPTLPHYPIWLHPCNNLCCPATRRHQPCSPAAQALEVVDGAVLAAVQRQGLAEGPATVGLAALRTAWQLAGLEDPMATMYLPDGARSQFRLKFE